MQNMINWLFICRVNFVPFLLPWQWYVAHLSMLSKAERRAWVRSCRQRGERPPMYPSGHQCIPSHQRTSNLLLPTTYENHAVVDSSKLFTAHSTLSTVCSVSLTISPMFQYCSTILYHIDFVASFTLSNSDCESDFEWRLHPTGS